MLLVTRTTSAASAIARTPPSAPRGVSRAYADSRSGINQPSGPFSSRPGAFVFLVFLAALVLTTLAFAVALVDFLLRVFAMVFHGTPTRGDTQDERGK